MSGSIDFKKRDKAFYMPPATPHLIEVPRMRFLMVDGAGDPNTAPAYQEAMEALYTISYAIKMSKMANAQPEGYFEYVVPPLEGLWQTDGPLYDDHGQMNKAAFRWTSMIRQPDFVTEAVLSTAKAASLKKKPALDTSRVRLEEWTEGLCVQMMHLGAYDDEIATVRRMDEFAAVAGCELDFSDVRRHHEIYLSDPRKTASEKLKTVLRHPVVKR